MPQQFPGFLQAQAQIEVARCVVQVQAKQALQLAPGDVDRFGQGQRAEGAFGLLLHLSDHVHQFLVGGAVARSDLHALVVLARADAAQYELFGHLNRQLGAVRLGDQVEHQVDGRCAPCAGDAAAVDLEQFLGHGELWVGLLERFNGFPMQGQAMAIEQAGFSEHAGASVDGAQGHAFMIKATQPVLQGRGGELQRLKAGHHQQGRALFQRLQRRVGVDRHPIACLYRAAVGAQDVPAV